MSEVILSNVLQTGIALVISLALYWVLASLGQRWVRRVGRRGPDNAARANTLWGLIRRVLAIVVGVTAVLIVLTVWDVNLAPFVAVGSVVGVAIGFGAQNLVNDIVSGFFILAEDQFHVSDWVTINESEVEGEVREVRLRVTVLVDLSGDVHYVPNGEIRISTNHSQGEGQLIDLTVAHGSPVATVFEIMNEELQALSEDPEWKDLIHGVPQVLGVQSLEGMGITVRAMFNASPDSKFAVRREALRRLTDRLSKEGIEIPVPFLGRQV